jgi:hypothetical protein
VSKRYSRKSFKDSSVMKKPKLTFKEKRKLKEEKKMKKLLGILVRGLLLRNVGFAENKSEEQTLYFEVFS